jgi:hypothetical protein
MRAGGPTIAGLTGILRDSQGLTETCSHPSVTHRSRARGLTGIHEDSRDSPGLTLTMPLAFGVWVAVEQ